MNIKKLLSLLSLVLAMLVPFSAMAATVTQVISLPNGDAYTMLRGGMLTLEDYPQVWLVDDAGTPLTEHFEGLRSETNRLASFTVSGDFNTRGLLDTVTGLQLLPPTYGTVEILSPDWYAGLVFALSEDDEYD